ncbi:MAG: DUF4097 domain-containing protein, partial [Acidobacteriota bacterium]
KGRDASPEEVKIQKEEGSQARLSVQFPVDRFQKFVYPALGSSDSSFSMQGRDAGFLSRIFGGGVIRVSGRGRGHEVWADITIRVPAQAELIVDHGLGRIKASGVEGDLQLNIHSGALKASNVQGEIRLNTGSGSVAVEDVDGRVKIGTGSGGVKLIQVKGSEIRVNTGSGSVTARGVEADRLMLGTGSGSIRAENIQASGATVETGSGSVTLLLSKMGAGRFKVGTGSGSIRLGLPHEASARVRAETGSGGIHLDLDEVRLNGPFAPHDHELSFTVGEGEADIKLETGGGAIRIARNE